MSESTTSSGWIRAADKARIIVVSGAKGGVGKTVFSANLAVYLATIGRRVVLVDADSAGANAHTVLGCERPRPTPADALGAFVETSIPGLRLLRAGLDSLASGGHRTLRRSRLLEGVRELDADHIVIDIGAGTVSSLVDLYLNADLSVYLTLPEPTALENTYRFLRGAFLRRLRTQAPSKQMRMRLMDAARALGGTPPPRDLLESIEQNGSAEDAAFVREQMRAFAPRIVMNQARVRTDLELGDAMRTVLHRRFSIDVDYLGHIEYDDTVWSCLRARRPLLVESPGTKASKGIEKIARRLLSAEAGRARRIALPSVPYESHHDLLEVERGATDEEIRRAYKRAREVYAPDSLACYAVLEPKELQALRTRVEEAHEVLLDPVRRKAHELSVFADASPAPDLEPARPTDMELPRMPEITPDTEFNGPLLGLVRQARGLSIKDVANKTKISVLYLNAIEEDDFSTLPDAPVYVRGFVAEFAKTLGLDAEQVCRSYVKRYKRYVEDRKLRGQP